MDAIATPNRDRLDKTSRLQMRRRFHLGPAKGGEPLQAAAPAVALLWFGRKGGPIRSRQGCNTPAAQANWKHETPGPGKLRDAGQSRPSDDLPATIY